MAITAALVFQGAQRLRYLLTATLTSDDSVTITTTGAPTPDVLTDTNGFQGPLKKLAKAFTQGYGALPAGVLTQAQARALWLADDPTNVVGNKLIPRAICTLTRRDDTTAAPNWRVDANVDGGGHPTIVVNAAEPDIAYLDIYVPGTIGE